MNFEQTEDRRLLGETLGRFVREQYPIETRHAAAATDEGFSREMWGRFAELGIIGALLPEEAGGFGGAGFDISTVFQELGRGLVVEPFLASAVLGAGILAELGTEEQKTILDDVVSGTCLLALAHGEPDSRYELARVATTATQTDTGWTLDGHKAVVLNGDSADRLVVSSRIAGDRSDEDGIALFLVDADAPGILRRACATVDGGRAAEIVFAGAPVMREAQLGAEGAAFPAIEKAAGRAILALCAEALGAMETARDLTLDYLKTRKQFGQPIGSFQALQHRMADMLTEIEQARSIVMHAAAALESERNERERALSAAKSLVGQVGRLVAEETIQMHGGIGVTWEYALPHYAKRLVMIDHLFGDTDHHLARFIALGAEDI